MTVYDERGDEIPARHVWDEIDEADYRARRAEADRLRAQLADRDPFGVADMSPDELRDRAVDDADDASCEWRTGE